MRSGGGWVAVGGGGSWYSLSENYVKQSGYDKHSVSLRKYNFPSAAVFRYFLPSLSVNRQSNGQGEGVQDPTDFAQSSRDTVERAKQEATGFQPVSFFFFLLLLPLFDSFFFFLDHYFQPDICTAPEILFSAR